MNTDKQLETYLDTAQAAALAGRSVSWLLRHRRSGTLSAYRVDGRVYFLADDVRALVAPTLDPRRVL